MIAHRDTAALAAFLTATLCGAAGVRLRLTASTNTRRNLGMGFIIAAGLMLTVMVFLAPAMRPDPLPNQ